MIILSQHGFFCIAPSSWPAIFFFKVSLSGEYSVLACLCSRRGWLWLPPLQTGCRFPVRACGSCSPQRGGGHPLHSQLPRHLLQAQQQAVIVLNRGLAVVNSRKVAHAGTLPVDNLKEDFLSGPSIVTCAIVLSCHCVFPLR